MYKLYLYEAKEIPPETVIKPASKVIIWTPGRIKIDGLCIENRDYYSIYTGIVSFQVTYKSIGNNKIEVLIPGKIEVVLGTLIDLIPNIPYMCKMIDWRIGYTEKTYLCTNPVITLYTIPNVSISPTIDLKLITDTSIVAVIHDPDRVYEI